MIQTRHILNQAIVTLKISTYNNTYPTLCPLRAEIFSLCRPEIRNSHKTFARRRSPATSAFRCCSPLPLAPVETAEIPSPVEVSAAWNIHQAAEWTAFPLCRPSFHIPISFRRAKGGEPGEGVSPFWPAFHVLRILRTAFSKSGHQWSCASSAVLPELSTFPRQTVTTAGKNYLCIRTIRSSAQRT
jgi:hypothetical protein